jgi:branched-subunit amino acid ABC-type transport system permease component
MHSAILQAINGISLAALLFLLASGFTLTFGLMRVVNMAHGAYYLLGGYIGYSITRQTGSFALGVAGGGLAVVIYYVIAAIALILYLRSPRSILKLRIVPLQARLFKDVLRVGSLWRSARFRSTSRSSS